MKAEKEPLIFSPEAEAILQSYVAWDLCSCDLAINSANAIERLLASEWVHFPANGYPAGALTRNFSRTEKAEFPDERIWWIANPASAPESSEGVTAKNIREKYLAEVWTFVGNDTLKVGYIRRLLDRPELWDRLIQCVQECDKKELDALILEGPYVYRQQETFRTINRTLHSQKAGLGSYTARAFAPDDLHAIALKPWVRWDSAKRDALIRALPIDPTKISPEILIQLWLAPDDFMTYPQQARYRYTLTVRKRLLTLFSQAREVNRTGEGDKTARILEITREDEQKRIAIFRTTTAVDIEEIDEIKHHNRYYEISKTYCTMYENMQDALWSQVHAIESLERKITPYRELLEDFVKYDTLLPEEREALMTRSFGIFKQHKSFASGKLIPLLSKLQQAEKNRGGHNIQLVNIISTLSWALNSITAKKTEINTVRELLEESQGN